jgi:rubrerythrin
MIQGFKWREQDGQMYDLEYDDELIEGQDRLEYCTSTVFDVVYTTELNRVWMCQECGYLYIQMLIDKTAPRVEGFHIKPAPTWEGV